MHRASVSEVVLCVRTAHPQVYYREAADVRLTWAGAGVTDSGAGGRAVAA